MILGTIKFPPNWKQQQRRRQEGPFDNDPTFATANGFLNYLSINRQGGVGLGQAAVWHQMELALV